MARRLIYIVLFEVANCLGVGKTNRSIVPYTLFILHCTFFFACGNLRTEIDPATLPNEPERLVVYSYISPQDTVLSVKVGRSSPVLDDLTAADPINLSSANVSLSNGSQTVTLRHNPSEQLYQVRASAMPIVAGRTYTLTVTTTNGKRITAQANVPKPVAIQRIRLDSLSQLVGNEWQKFYFMTFSWQDPRGEANYYRYQGTFEWNAGSSYPINGQASQRPVTLRSLSFQREATTGNLLTDTNLDGTLLSSLASNAVVGVAVGANLPNAQTQLANFRLTNLYPGAIITGQLFHIEKIHYQHADAIIRQRRNRDNPFAEPVLIPSNIQGGLGCFAGYNRTVLALYPR